MKRSNINQFVENESKLLITNAKELGENHAENTLPNASDPSMKLYVQTIAKDFESLWRRVESIFLDSNSVYELAEIQHSKNLNIGKMKENELRDTKHQRDKLKAEIQQLPKVLNWRIVFGVILFFIAFVSIESLFNSSFIQMLIRDISYTVAIIIGLFFYVIMFFAILHFETKIKQASTPQKKKLYRILFYGIMLSFISITSYARTLFTMDKFDWLVFLGLFSMNCLIFIGLLFMHRFVPSRKEIQDLLEYRKVEKKLKNLDQTLQSLKLEINQKAVDNMDLVKETKSQMLSLDKHKEYLISQYELAVSSYIETNIKLRTDRLIPNCFSKSIPTLNL